MHTSLLLSGLFSLHFAESTSRTAFRAANQTCPSDFGKYFHYFAHTGILRMYFFAIFTFKVSISQMISIINDFPPRIFYINARINAFLRLFYKIPIYLCILPHKIYKNHNLHLAQRMIYWERTRNFERNRPCKGITPLQRL